MTAEKRICFLIMICQMTAILSAVAMLYLAVSVVIPSAVELTDNFNLDPVMCTTMNTSDATIKDISDTEFERPKCESFSCIEWCLSTPSSPCVHVSVMPRIMGAEIDFEECEDIIDEPCSALNVSKAEIKNCKKGECQNLNGNYNCSKGSIDYNPCREITPAYFCRGAILHENATQCADRCDKRLEGVYACIPGFCQQVTNYDTHEKCERKCINMNLRDKNVVIFSKERLITIRCQSTASNIAKLEALNSNTRWRSSKDVLVIFCTFIEFDEGNTTILIRTEDCFDGKLTSSKNISDLTSYDELIKLSEALYKEDGEWILEPEETLRIMNDTLLRVNGAGCVNTLQKECSEFFRTHAVDGSDGRTRDRYKCFYSNLTFEYVLGKFDPELTFVHLVIGSVVPASLFIVACLCLFLCSKSVGVDEGGHLKVVLLPDKDGSGDASEL